MINQQLFENHELAPVHSDPLPLSVSHPLWLFAVLMVIAALVVIVRIFYRKNISEIVRAFLSMSVSGQLMREESILLKRASLLLTIIFNLTAAFMVWQFGAGLADKLPLVLSDFGRFLLFALIIALIYSAKYLILKLTGFIFEINREADAYIFNIFLSNNLFGMVLFPLIVFLFLYPQLSDSGILFIAIIAIAMLFFFYRILRGILIGRASSVWSPVYLFLYICALEFAPLAVLVKVLAPR